MTPLRSRTRRIRKESPVTGLAPRVAQLATVGLVAGLLLAANTPAQADPDPGSTQAASTSQAPSPKRAAACSNLLVVAVDGNGQGKKDTPGQAVAAITNKLTATATKQGRSVTVKRVRLSTPGAVVTLRTKRGAGASAVSKAGLQRWKKPIRSGVKATRKLVNARLDGCPDQQVMLVGYAQGAAVVHEVLQDLDKKDALGKVVGAVTVSDPSRVRKSSTGRPLGSPAAAKNSEGILTRFTKSRGDVPSATSTFGVVSVCHKGDLVCNPSKVAAAKALKLSLSYGSKSSRSAMRTAAARAWARAALWPVPTTQQVVVGVKEPISSQIGVSGGSTTSPAAAFTAVSVPAGLSLSATGVVSGQVDTPGSYPITYTLAGVSPATTPTTHSVTVLVREPSSGAAAGGQSSCAVRSDSSAWCQGRNDFGQLGDGTTTLRVSPVAVVGTGWSRISTGGGSTCAVKLDGTLWCWGLNNFGQLGGPDRATSLVPRQVGTTTTWREVSVSWQHACATQADGSAWCWGQNERGQLGNGTSGPPSGGPVRVLGDQQWTSVVAGGWTTCGTTTTGTAYCWGENSMGSVGDGTITNRNRPTVVTGGLQFSQVSATWGRACGVTPTGQVWCWGENSNGELGDGTRTNSAKPVQVGASGSFTSVATAVTASCAVRTDGQVLCWGDNRYGQLGPAASGGGSSTPVAAGVVAAGRITGGWLHLCAEGAGCWGANDVGQLGNGTITQASMPAAAATWAAAPVVSTQQMKKWGPSKVVRNAIATRPGVSGRAKGSRRATTAVQVMTFNLLGSQHTAPGGARPNFAPGRVRAEWAKNLINQRGSTLIGLSEPQPDQINSLDVATNGDFTVYPGNTMGYDAAPQSVMWKDSEWSYVWGTTVQMPFMKGSRPQALVRLKNRSTGQEIYWVNAHLSPGKMQDDRDKGMETIKQVVKQLGGDGLPVLVTGDLNEHVKAFRRIACPTQMNAAVGGRTGGNSCQPPKAMRVDWIFGKGGTFDDTEVNQGAQVRRTTDHAVVSSRFTVQ